MGDALLIVGWLLLLGRLWWVEVGRHLAGS
jgi:hypothetical protein